MKSPLTERVQRCSVAAEQLVAAEQIAEGQGKIRGILYRDWQISLDLLFPAI